jgi:hypothetical protein
MAARVEAAGAREPLRPAAGPARLIDTGMSEEAMARLGELERMLQA